MILVNAFGGEKKKEEEIPVYQGPPDLGF